MTKAQNSTTASAGSVGARGRLKIYDLRRWREGVFIKDQTTWGNGFCQDRKPVFHRKPAQLKGKASFGDSQERKHRRARTMVRRLALKYELRFMWSLTFAAEVKDLGDAWHQWENFRRRMKRAGLMPEQWIVVPELQKKTGRNVWHFHVICNRFVSFERLRDTWGNGHVWVKAGHPKGAASYASKYLSKGFEESEQRELGDHRYRRSLGMNIESCSVELKEEEVEAGAVERLIKKDGYRVEASMQTEDGTLWYLLSRPMKYQGQILPPELDYLMEEEEASGYDPPEAEPIYSV